MADFGSSRFSANGAGGLFPGTEWAILGVFEEVFQTHHYLAIKFDKGDKKPIEGISLGLRRLYQAKTIRRIVNNAEQDAPTVAVPAGSLVDLIKEEVTKLGPGATNDQVREALNKVLPGKHLRIDEDCLYVDSFHKVKTWISFNLID